jgi:uncharacterized protein YcbK (DUF882 family)
MRAPALFVAAISIALPCFAQNHNARPVAHTTYVSSVRSWHTPVPDRTAPVDDNGRTKLALVALNTQERLEIPALTTSGGFATRDLDRAAHLLREPSSGNEHPIEPRVLDAIYRIQTHFAAQEIRIISGYRTPASIASSRGSQHGRGRAIDVIVPGTTDDDVAKFARDMGYMGVGVYPASGFVHVDVRDRSYFWVDSSGPGGRTRERGILSDVAAKADREAAARGEKGVPPVTIAADVDALLGGHVAPALPVQEEDED